MTSLERVSCALKFQEPDRVPVYPIATGVTRHLTDISYYDFANDSRKCADALIRGTEELGLDMFCPLIDLSIEAEDFGQELEYPKDEAAHPVIDNRLIKSLEDYYKIEPIDVTKARRMNYYADMCDILVKEKGDQYPVVPVVFGPLGITSMLRDQATMYLDMLDDPDAVKHAVDAVSVSLIDYCDMLIDRGVYAIMFITLFASASIMRKSMWMEFEGEAVRKIADHVHKRGCMVMVHNCGNGVYFDAQIEAMKPEAISFLHVPDDCADFAECKEKYGKVTGLMGCIPPTWLPKASYEEVLAESKKQIDIFAKGGGYVLATGCEYPANLDLSAARAMVEAAKTYGVYTK